MTKRWYSILLLGLAFLFVLSTIGCPIIEEDEVNSGSSNLDSDYQEYDGRQPPYASNSLGTRIELLNNPQAHDPTWQELMNFLSLDRTDERTYWNLIYVCGSFAEDVHNNAEAAGLRAAWVVIEFATGGDDHALNAFMTTDKGLVFTDCTGQPLTIRIPTLKYDPTTGTFVSVPDSGSSSSDKVAYVSIDQELGLVSAAFAVSPTYDSYIMYLSDCDKYEQMLDDYNAEVTEYNLEVARYTRELGGRTVLPEPDYSYFMNWYNRLTSWSYVIDGMYSDLHALESKTGNQFWDPLGVVSKIEIYW